MRGTSSFGGHHEGAGAAVSLDSYAAVLVLTDEGAAAAFADLAAASSVVVLTNSKAPAFSALVLSAVVRALLSDRGHSPRCYRHPNPANLQQRLK